MLTTTASIIKSPPQKKRMILHVHRPRMTNEDLLWGNHELWAGGAKDDHTAEIKRAEEIYK